MKLQYKGIVKMTVAGRITIPKEIRDKLKLREGDKFEIVLKDNVVELRKVAK